MTENKRNRGRPAKKEPTTRVEFRADVVQKNAWEKAAKAEDKTLSAWLKALADKAAKLKK